MKDESTTIVVTTPTLIERLKAMPPAGTLPEAQRKKQNSVNEEAGNRSGHYTDKDKKVLGVVDENAITWAYPNFERLTYLKLKAIAFKAIENKQGVSPMREMFTRIIHQWVKDNIEEITSIAGEIEIADKTEEDIEKEIQAAQAALQRKLELLKKMRSAGKK